ncbi:hypothetical protein V22_01740 [Calycomorphotria hydatis]|uniref:Uncharacterized protein n=1 Tax=Calycomorphotria hydatis TaxID=2528027 RepID=A0A517T3M2_9PLAN|nr:hypothetical protein V22_01740 [Calycomorphotria hydatis]
MECFFGDGVLKTVGPEEMYWTRVTLVRLGEVWIPVFTGMTSLSLLGLHRFV